MGYLVKQSHRAPANGPAPADESLPRACVIGAGSSGIAGAKHLHQAGVPFDCFEMGSDIGGTWVLDNSNGQSACYDTLEINTSCARMAYSDFPMPAGAWRSTACPGRSTRPASPTRCSRSGSASASRRAR